MNTFGEIYKQVRLIPKGRVASYGWIARKIGVKDIRVVGWALHCNKDPKKTPCHRVVKKDGSLAGGYVFGGKDKQKQLLLDEGIRFDSQNRVKSEFSIEEKQLGDS